MIIDARSVSCGFQRIPAMYSNFMAATVPI